MPGPRTHRFLPLLAAGLGALLAGCVSRPAYELTGATHPPVSPDQVLVLSQPPPQFQDVAIVRASDRTLNPRNPAAFDAVVQRLRQQAASLGANAIIIEGFSDRQSATIGTGFGSSSYGPNSAVGVGVSSGFGIYSKSGQARAVFIPPGAPRPMPLEPTGAPPPPPPQPPAAPTAR